jgi:hypothetical protein
LGSVGPTGRKGGSGRSGSQWAVTLLC